jgi:hypothetical protein
MKLFVIQTVSESCDHRTYVIKHHEKPTESELKAFLIEYSSDKDDDEHVLYESIEEVTEVIEGDALAIPKMSKAKLSKWMG